MIYQYIYLFFSFSIAGWCMEVVLKYIQYHRFINRGFFIGPYCPIYGSGAVLLTICVDIVSPLEASYGMAFWISFFVCGTVEYLASLFMEKKYHARWWDYSKKPMNLNGRIWIGNLILFGVGGVAIIKVFNPSLLDIFYSIPVTGREVGLTVISVTFAADYITSHFIMKLVKTGVESSEADNTEAISKEIQMLLSDKSVLHRRFVNAYPEVIYKTEKISKRLEEVRKETERMRAEAEERIENVSQRIAEGKEELAEKLEPTGSIKNTIIEKQDKLIEALMTEERNDEQIHLLQDEIEGKKKLLEGRRNLIKGYKQERA